MNRVADYIKDEQDEKTVEKTIDKLEGLLMTDEELLYISVQKKPALNIAPDSIAATSKRIIFFLPKNLGLSMDFQDYFWKDVHHCQIKEGFLGADFEVQTNTGAVNKMDYLPKVQARILYKISQEQEEKQKETRRQHDLEEKRATAGTITVAAVPAAESAPIVEGKKEETTPKPTEHTADAPPTTADPVESLKKLKDLLDNDLIDRYEYDSKKAEILGRL